MLPVVVAAVLILALVALGLDVEHGGLISRAFDTPVHDWFVEHRVCIGWAHLAGNAACNRSGQFTFEHALMLITRLS